MLALATAQQEDHHFQHGEGRLLEGNKALPVLQNYPNLPFCLRPGQRLPNSSRRRASAAPTPTGYTVTARQCSRASAAAGSKAPRIHEATQDIRGISKATHTATATGLRLASLLVLL